MLYKEYLAQFKYLQLTVTKTSLVAGLPIPFSAVHLNNPSSCLLTVSGKVTFLPSETFLQVIFGRGDPTEASQFRVRSPVSFTLWLEDMKVISGGTAM